MRVPRRFRRSGKIGHAICIAGIQVPLAHRHGGGACARETVRSYGEWRGRIQPVDATIWLNRSAGVSKSSVFRGRSLSRLAMASSLACE